MVFEIQNKISYRWAQKQLQCRHFDIGDSNGMPEQKNGNRKNTAVKSLIADFQYSQKTQKPKPTVKIKSVEPIRF